MTNTKNDFFYAAYNGDLAAVKAAIEAGQPVNEFGPCGLTAFHLAVGRDQLEMARYLVEKGAIFTPDERGRWPSVIAAECQVSDDMSDFVLDEEVKYDVGPWPEPQP